MGEVHFFLQAGEKRFGLRGVEASVDVGLLDAPEEIMGVLTGQPVDKLPGFKESPMVQVMLDQDVGGMLEGLVIGRNHSHLFESAELAGSLLGGWILGKGDIGLLGPEFGVNSTRLLEYFGERIQGDRHVARVLRNHLLQVEVPRLDVAGLVGVGRQLAQFLVALFPRGGSSEGEPNPQKHCRCAKIHPGNSTRG